VAKPSKNKAPQVDGIKKVKEKGNDGIDGIRLVAVRG
jgi:hypothetical protein